VGEGGPRFFLSSAPASSQPIAPLDELPRASSLSQSLEEDEGEDGAGKPVAGEDKTCQHEGCFRRYRRPGQYCAKHGGGRCEWPGCLLMHTGKDGDRYFCRKHLGREDFMSLVCQQEMEEQRIGRCIAANVYIVPSTGATLPVASTVSPSGGSTRWSTYTLPLGGRKANFKRRNPLGGPDLLVPGAHLPYRRDRLCRELKCTYRYVRASKGGGGGFHVVKLREGGKEGGREGGRGYSLVTMASFKTS